jgi:Flp pilus assembly protein TadG
MNPRRIGSCIRGNMSVEFALVLPVFLVLITGCMEYCRVLWMVQSLNSVAYSTARCVTYGTGVTSGTNCSTDAATQDYAVSLAAKYGLSVQSGDVTKTTNQTCNGNTGLIKVTVQKTFSSPFAGLINTFPSTVTGVGCYKP